MWKEKSVVASWNGSNLVVVKVVAVGIPLVRSKW